MDLQMILFIALIIIFFIIPLLVFIIKSAVKQGILEAYKIIKMIKIIIFYNSNLKSSMFNKNPLFKELDILQLFLVISCIRLI